MSLPTKKILLFSLLMVIEVIASPFFPSHIQAKPFPHLFGYKEIPQTDMTLLPQWGQVSRRHPKEDFDKKVVSLHNWLTFLNDLKQLPPREQIERVNRFANKKKYIIDLTNYGQEDYWAIVKEFLDNNGDCEDYSITKYFSLRYLGFDQEDLRILILQDTNLGIAHAVLTVSFNGDVLLLDNQSQEILSHKDIAHYTPLYSVNESQWWLHLPPGL